MNQPVEEILVLRRVAVVAAEKELHCIIAGSFFKRRIQGKIRHCLSRMRDGKQRQNYVSGKHAQAVERGSRHYAKLMELICEISELNLELVKKGNDIHV